MEILVVVVVFFLQPVDFICAKLSSYLLLRGIELLKSGSPCSCMGHCCASSVSVLHNRLWVSLITKLLIQFKRLPVLYPERSTTKAGNDWKLSSCCHLKEERKNNNTMVKCPALYLKICTCHCLHFMKFNFFSFIHMHI